jgi:3-hydroxybutyryl-CoA dehydratase
MGDLPAVGDRASITKAIAQADLERFAEVSLDTNPVHFDEAFAAKTRFGGRIAHGMIAAALVSAVLGTKLPGPGTIYLSQSLAFKGPVRVGDVIVATVVVKAVRGDKGIITLETTVANQRGEPVLSGEAVVLVERVG